MSSDDAIPVEPSLVILSENPIQQIWTQLSAWESRNLARKLIEERAQKAGVALADDIMHGKAQALSYCIRTARENVRNPGTALTVGSVCNYYGCMWLAAAMLAADPKNNIDLSRLEEITKRGHGLGNLHGEGHFPQNEYLYVREGGFFREFLKARGVSREGLSEISVAGAQPPPPTDMPKEQRERLISLDSLFARIPELRAIYEYVSGVPALSFGVYHASINMGENVEDRRAAGELFGPHQRKRDYTWLGVTGSAYMSKDCFERAKLPLTEIDFRTYAGKSEWTGKLMHPAGTWWYDHIPLHRSAMTGTSWISPVLGHIGDAFTINLMLLYGLSILARYRPAIWREVVEGELDQYRPLVVGYADIAQRVLPELALRDISQRRIHVTLPGSFTAPV